MYVTRYNPTRDLNEFRRGFGNLNSFFDTFLEKRASVSLADFEPSVIQEGVSLPRIEG